MLINTGKILYIYKGFSLQVTMNVTDENYIRLDAFYNSADVWFILVQNLQSGTEN